MRRIKDKMMISVLASMAILLIGLTVTIALYIYVTQKDNLLNRNLLTARSYASQIDSFVNKYNSIAQTLAYSQLNNESPIRHDVLKFLKQMAEEDTNILGSWVIYEPNAFDYQDFQNINTVGHDRTGRFLPYWNRLKGKLILEPVLDVDTSDFYTIPKKTKEVFIPTPFIYEGVLMMSFCYPIIKKNTFQGAAGLDISIETVKKLLEGFDEKKIYKSNSAILVSNSGIFISASNHLFDNYIINKQTLSHLSKELGIPEYEILSEEIRQGKEGFLNTKDPFSKEEIITFYSPIKAGNLSIIVSISKSDLLANTLTAIYILAFIGIASLLIIAAILYFLINTIIDPLNKLTDTVVEFGKQDFTKRSTVLTNDEIGELSTNFNSMANAIEEYSNEMEKKVKVRTLELNKTLHEVTKLKFQQDGDYFLTSILLNPFYKKAATSKNFKLDFLIEQKKTFAFKEKNLSIGGDICYTDSIQLRGMPFIIFLNGDAMGKSLQGAGGALILGSVFGAIIERCKTNIDQQNFSPERWLKNTFIELHKTFETFDGSMLVSVVIGLLEEEGNTMYYINAEHPGTILYRDACASFIEDDLGLCKLGTPMLVGKLAIKVFTLKPNDVILIGSDGKDDLVLSVNSSGSRDINQDEKLFLRIVEQSLGEISAIKKNLSTRGELMDDLSLLRIEYLGNGRDNLQEIENIVVSTKIQAIELLESMASTNPLVLKRLSKLYIKEREFEKAFSCIFSYVTINASDTEGLHIACFCSMKVNRYPLAIEFGERSLLREPWNERYFNLLAKVLDKAKKSKLTQV